MSLSQRANKFLSQQEYRNDTVSEMEIIQEAFRKAGLEPTSKLIDFQLKYGGLMVYSGLEPICFGILHGENSRGDFAFPEKKINELIYYPDWQDETKIQFNCADTRYQENFSLDRDGNYYEGGEVKATKFDFIIEDLSIFQELQDQGYSKSTSKHFENIIIDVNKIKSDLKLDDYPNFPQDKIYWGASQNLALRVGIDKISLFSKSEIPPEKIKYLDNLVKK